MRSFLSCIVNKNLSVMKRLFHYLGAFTLSLILLFSCDENKEQQKFDEDQKVSYYSYEEEIVPTVDESNDLKGAKVGLWNSLTGPPAQVEGPYVGEVDGNIIVAGGFGVGGDLTTVQIYNIGGQVWTSGASVPVPNCEGTAVTVNDVFYVIGGRTNKNVFFSYDLFTDTWNTTLPALPSPRAGLASAVVGDMIYVMGGRTGTAPLSGTPLATVERYDILNNAWQTMAPLPSPRMDLAAAAVGNKIFVFGGSTGFLAGMMTDVDVYDPNTDTWDTSPTDMLTPRAVMYACADKGGMIYLIGGTSDGTTATGVVEAYKVSTDTWITGYASIPTPRGEAGAVSHAGGIYMVGGAQPHSGTFASVSAMEVFYPKKK